MSTSDSSNPPFASPAFERMKQRVLARSVTEVRTGWEDVIIPHGLVHCARQFGNEAMLDWVEAWFAHHSEVPVNRDPAIGIFGKSRFKHGFILNSYCGSWGAPLALALLHEIRPRKTYLEFLRLSCDVMLEDSIRLKDGVMATGYFLPDAIWVDTMFYSASVLSEGYRATGDERYATEAIRQCLLHARALRDERTGCFFHDVTETTGRRSSWFWARGNGWAIVALADTLQHVPPETPGYDEVLELYRSIVVGLLRLVHPCGLWRVVPEVGHAHLETSGSAMIAIGLAVGVRTGWIEPIVAVDVRRALHELETWVYDDGALMGAQGPAGTGGWERHKLIAFGEFTYATGFVLRLIAEADKMEQHLKER